MRKIKFGTLRNLNLLIIVVIFFSSCVTSAKMDRFVAKQYNNQISSLPKKKNNDIVITTPLATNSTQISTAITKTSKMLPLIVYWQWEYKNMCTLNPAIPVNSFINTMNSGASKPLVQKLNGKKLEITIEQVPNVFSFVDKAHMIWLIYAIGWDNIYIQPNKKEMIVDYKLFQDSSTTKTGTITIPNYEANRPVRMFQSWKRAASEYISTYNIDITNMTKAVISKLTQEIE